MQIERLHNRIENRKDGVQIRLTGDEVAIAIETWLLARGVHIRGSRTITVNGDLCDRGNVYVDPSGDVITNNAAVAQQSTQAAGSCSVCTAGSPMPKNASGRWQHPDAKSDPINDSIYYDHYDCPHCGLHFTVEVAE
jgi:hypothetical protein